MPLWVLPLLRVMHFVESYALCRVLQKAMAAVCWRPFFEDCDAVFASSGLALSGAPQVLVVFT